MKKFSKQVSQLIDFIQFTHEFQEVVRVARPPYRERYENDAEHSYQLAMVAWFIIDQEKLRLNKEKCLMYALSHDLVEIYAGDTFVFDKEHAVSKKKREADAFKKIKKRFKNFTSLIRTIEQYEKKKDIESKFIYALDKIVTPIQIYLEKGGLWHEKKVDLETLIEYKNDKVSVSPVIDKYWQEILCHIKEEKDVLFPKS